MAPLPVTLLSQRDPRWAGKNLGTSPQTIGTHGCVITALTMLAGEVDVGRTNDLFNQHGVYVQGNLVWWSQVQKAFTDLKFNWRSSVYDNNQVANWIYNKKIPVIVEVDAAPIGSPRTSHYVLFLGEQRLADPWDGTIKSTLAYPNLKGYVLYEKSETLSNEQLVAKTREILRSGDNSFDKEFKLKQLYNIS